jgi:hypothetical protein
VFYDADIDGEQLLVANKVSNVYVANRLIAIHQNQLLVNMSIGLHMNNVVGIAGYMTQSRLSPSVSHAFVATHKGELWDVSWHYNA